MKWIYCYFVFEIFFLSFGPVSAAVRNPRQPGPTQKDQLLSREKTKKFNSNLMDESKPLTKKKRNYATARHKLSNRMISSLVSASSISRYEPEVNLASSGVSGYISATFSVGDTCADAESVTTYLLGTCFATDISDTYDDDYFDDDSFISKWFIWEVVSMNSLYIVINQTEYSSHTCASPMYATLVNLSTACYYSGPTVPYNTPYSYWSYSFEVPNYGAGSTYGGYASPTCSGDFSMQIWETNDICIDNGDGTSYSTSCAQNGYAFIEYFNSYSASSTCEGTVESSIYPETTVCYSTGTNYALTSCFGYPPVVNCVNSSQIKYNNAGSPAFVDTFQTCLENLGGDAPLFAGFAMPELTPMEMTITISLNNIINVDAITSSVTLDFMMYATWLDPRLAMPAFFAKAGYYLMEITSLVGQADISGNQVDIWLPNLVFMNALSIDTPSKFIRLFSDGTVAWNQHFVLTITESSLNYKLYPKDTQQLSIQWYSVSLYSDQLTFTTEVDYMFSSVNYPQYAVEENQIWMFDSAVATTGANQPGSFYSARQYGLVTVTITRQATGVVLRLAFPVFLLVVLAALSYWADPEDRITSTVTILLAISALSIIVFGSIPMVGYLTTFDTFLTFMFVILCGCCVLHLFTVRLRREEKIAKWPMRQVYIRILEFVGRVVTLPVITIMYTGAFRGTLKRTQSALALTLVLVFVSVVAVREFGSLRSTFIAAMKDIGSKMTNLKDLSTFEILLFNLYMYRIVSTSSRRHMHHIEKQKQDLERDIRRMNRAKTGHTDADSDDEDVDSSNSTSRTATPNQDRGSVDMAAGVNPMINRSV